MKRFCEDSNGPAYKKPHFKGDTQLLDLPNELFLEIASYLDLTDLCSLSLACKQISEVLRPEIKNFVKEYLWINDDSLYKVFGQKNKPPNFKLIYKSKIASEAAPIFFPGDLLLLANGDTLHLINYKKQTEIATTSIYDPLQGPDRVVSLLKLSDKYFQIITDCRVCIYALEDFKLMSCRHKGRIKMISTPKFMAFIKPSLIVQFNNLVILDSTGSTSLSIPLNERCYNIFVLDDWSFLAIEATHIMIYKIENLSQRKPCPINQFFRFGTNHIVTFEQFQS